MSITRTVDTNDSGSALDGTIHDNDWLQALYNALDARWSRKTITSTGSVNNLSVDDADFVIFNNATDLTITGIAAPSSPAKPGKPLRYVCTGAGNVYFKHQSASSTAANRLINFVTSGDTPHAAGVGAGMLVYDDANSRWRLVHHEQGAYITRTFASGNYTASGSMTWTVASAITDAYYLKGRQLTLTEAVLGTMGGTAAAELRVTLPNSYLAAKRQFTPIITSDGTTSRVSSGDVQAGVAYLRAFMDPAGSNWVVGGATSAVECTVTVEVT